MRVLFLDIDGVMNRAATWDSTRRTGLFDPEPCRQLRRILDRTRAGVVVTSTGWKIRSQAFGGLRMMFAVNGIEQARFIGTTTHQLAHRGADIAAWLDAYPIKATSFAILDDGDDMEPYLDRLVRTDPQVGLTAENSEKIIRLLNCK